MTRQRRTPNRSSQTQNSTPMPQSMIDSFQANQSQTSDNSSLTTPVLETSSYSTSSNSIPEFSPEPIKSSMSDQLGEIKRKALEIQGVLNKRAEAENNTSTNTTFNGITEQTTTEEGATPGEIGAYDPAYTPETATAEEAKAGYFNAMNTDTADAKQAIRDEENLASKRQFANSLYNEILSEEKAHRDEVRRLRTNPEGKSMGALNAQIQRLEMDYSSTRADDMLAYNLALGDFQEAEKTVNARIADLDADLDRKAQMWAMAFQFAQDDMTESEKLEAQQLFDSQMTDKKHEYALEITNLNDRLARERSAIDRANSSSKRSTAITEINGKKSLVDTQTGEVIKTFEAGDPALTEIETARQVQFIDDLVGLADHDGLNAAVGNWGVMRWNITDLGGSKEEFIGKTENIIKTLTLNTFAEAKEKGMTFGAMSKDEWQILGDSATALSNYRELDGKGNVVGYDVSEKAFKRELDKLTSFARLDAVIKGTPAEDVGVSILVNPNTNETEYWSINSFGEPTLIR